MSGLLYCTLGVYETKQQRNRLYTPALDIMGSRGVDKLDFSNKQSSVVHKRCDTNNSDQEAENNSLLTPKKEPLTMETELGSENTEVNKILFV